MVSPRSLRSRGRKQSEPPCATYAALGAGRAEKAVRPAPSGPEGSGTGRDWHGRQDHATCEESAFQPGSRGQGLPGPPPYFSWTHCCSWEEEAAGPGPPRGDGARVRSG